MKNRDVLFFRETRLPPRELAPGKSSMSLFLALVALPTMDDSEYLQRTVTHRSHWSYRPEQKPTDSPCDASAARRFTTGE
jgi:hypothetical protein